MWKPLLVLAASTLSITTSAALILPLTRNTSLAFLTPTNITNSALEQPPAALADYVRYPSWPKLPYGIDLPGTGHTNVRLEIHGANPYRTSPMTNVRDLQLFLQEFADGLRQEYPPPGFIPRSTNKHASDVTSHSWWAIWFKEGPTMGRMPTTMALAALDRLENELGKYGPANVDFSIRTKGFRSPWALGMLVLSQITGASFNGSLSNESDSLQIA